MTDIQLRKFDRETLQRLSQVLGHMNIEAQHTLAVFSDDPGDLALNVFGDREVRVKVSPGRSGKGGMLLRLHGPGMSPAVTVFPTKNPGDFVPSIVKALAGLMGRAYATLLAGEDLQREVDSAE